ncbi:MAG: DUF3109 family protein [Muribaculaceae bacterium]|nr:DUF3109 family protein [Muribaculaceae bacterium]MDE6793775.1 DUF3109 family protein [Muribaculaceae bacterium]
MLVIKDTLVSLDLIERFFVCDLDVCLGQCCIDGDAGAPLLEEERDAIDAHMPEILPTLNPAARRIIEEEGSSYIDPDGDLVTQIVEGRDCVYTCYAQGGKCLCALEKAYREGKLPQLKPSSCHLYPVRLKKIGNMTAVNLHRWKICKSAEIKGRKEGVRAYQFLKDPLIRKFGKEWYDELCLTAEEWLKAHN